LDNGQINWSQSSQPQAKATDQEKAAATEQAGKEESVCVMTPNGGIDSGPAASPLCAPSGARHRKR
jgi:hypothetical protein